MLDIEVIFSIHIHTEGTEKKMRKSISSTQHFDI